MRTRVIALWLFDFLALLPCSSSGDALRSAQLQLQKAIDTDDTIAIAKALLDHAHLKLQLPPLPMEALQQGDLQAAWERADRYDSKTRSLWHLLIAWHLQTKGKTADAKKTLQRLLASSLPYFAPDPENPLPYILLAQVAKVDSKTFDVLWQKLLETEWEINLVSYLLAANELDSASRLVRQIKRPKDMYAERVFDAALGDFAIALAKARRFDEALQIVRMVREPWNDPTLTIAQAMVDFGLFDRARKVGGNRILTHIAKVQAAKGKKDAAKATFIQAIVIAQKQKDERWLQELALSQAETIGIDDAIETARKIRNACL